MVVSENSQKLKRGEIKRLNYYKQISIQDVLMDHGYLVVEVKQFVC